MKHRKILHDVIKLVTVDIYHFDDDHASSVGNRPKISRYFYKIFVDCGLIPEFGMEFSFSGQYS